MKLLKYSIPLAVWAMLLIVQSQSFSQTESSDTPAGAKMVSHKTINHAGNNPNHSAMPHEDLPEQVSIVELRKLKLQRLFNAIRLVESKGNDRAVGDRGKARGPYQITLSYWRDACKQGNVNWDFYTCVWNRQLSEQIMLWYWRRHCPDALEEFYRTGNAEILIRVHNGGPTGQNKSQTRRYFGLVQGLMK